MEIWKTQQWPQDGKMSVFIPIPKKGNANEHSNYCTISLISYASTVILKILQSSFNSMWTVNFQMFKMDLEKADKQRSNCQHLLDHWKSKRVPGKHLLLLYWLDQSLWLYGFQQTVKNSSRDWIPHQLTCLLRNLYADQEATVRSGHGTMDWFKMGKTVCQGCVLSPCLFNLYSEFIMQNAGLDKAQAGIKVARRSIKNLRCADDTTLTQKAKN